MFKLIRMTLIATVLMAGYMAVLAMLIVPYLWLAIPIVVIAMACKKKPFSSGAHGTSRWADADDLGGMIDGK